MFSKMSLDVTGIVKRLQEDVIAVATDSNRPESDRLTAVCNVVKERAYLEGIQYAILKAERDIWESVGKQNQSA